MCHHYVGAKKLPKWLVDEFAIRSNLRLLTDLQGGVYPLSTVPVVRANDEGHDLVGMQWGLLPRWWKPSDKSPKRSTFQRKTFNARSESAHEKPAYREAFKRRRCLVPAQKFDEKKHYFSLPSGEAFCFAGLWESWRGDDGDVLTCTFLTTEPNDAVAGVGHHRMPVMLTTVADCRLWMSPDVVEAGPLAGLFEPYAGELVVTPAGERQPTTAPAERVAPRIINRDSCLDRLHSHGRHQHLANHTTDLKRACIRFCSDRSGVFQSPKRCAASCETAGHDGCGCRPARPVRKRR